MENVKVRVISYYEIEDMFKQILTELSGCPLDVKTVVETGGQLKFLLEVCISQMKAADAGSYPEKSKHLEILEKASAAISYKINTCTVEQIANQVDVAYRSFGPIESEAPTVIDRSAPLAT